jgi:hypothetical protein
MRCQADNRTPQASLSETERLALRDRLRQRLGVDATGSFTLHARVWAVKGVVATYFAAFDPRRAFV